LRAILSRVWRELIIASPVIAVALFSLTTSTLSPTIATLSALVALALISLSIRNPLPNPGPRVLVWAAMSTLVVMAVTLSPQRAETQMTLTDRAWWVLLVVAMSVAGIVGARTGDVAKRISLILGIAGFAVASVGIVVEEWDSPAGFDVYLVHKAAGGAIADGLNPYSDAVQVVNGSPTAPEGSMIVGYPYPPVIAGTYAVSSIATDPRIVSLVAWSVLVLALAVVAWRRLSRDSLPLAVFFLVASLPIWRLIWFGAWTEPLILFLFVAALVIWRRSALVAGVLLGLGLASKQYLVFLLPILLLYREDQYWRRLLFGAGAAVLTFLPFLLADPQAMGQALIGNIAGISFRPDTLSLPGMLYELGIVYELPRALWLALIAITGVIVGRYTRSARGLALSFAFVLGFAFLTGLAFLNYWFLVFGLVAFAVARPVPGFEDPIGMDSAAAHG